MLGRGQMLRLMSDRKRNDPESIKDNDKRSGRAEVGAFQNRGLRQRQTLRTERTELWVLSPETQVGCREHMGNSKKCHGEDTVTSEVKHRSKT